MELLSQRFLDRWLRPLNLCNSLHGSGHRIFFPFVASHHFMGACVTSLDEDRVLFLLPVCSESERPVVDLRKACMGAIIVLSSHANQNSNRYQLILFRALAGMGGGGMAVVGSVIVSDVVPLKSRGLYQGCTFIPT